MGCYFSNEDWISCFGVLGEVLVGLDGYSLCDVASGYTSILRHFLGDGRFIRGGREWYINVIKILASRIFQHVVEFFFREISINGQVKKKICYHVRWI